MGKGVSPSGEEGVEAGDRGRERRGGGVVEGSEDLVGYFAEVGDLAGDCAGSGGLWREVERGSSIGVVVPNVGVFGGDDVGFESSEDFGGELGGAAEVIGPASGGSQCHNIRTDSEGETDLSNKKHPQKVTLLASISFSVNPTTAPGSICNPISVAIRKLIPE